MSEASATAPGPARGEAWRVVRQRAWRYLPPLVVLMVVVALWELFASGEGPSTFPPPSEIVEGASQKSDLLLRAALATIVEAIGGLLLGTAAGMLVAFAAARWVIARDVFLPLAIGASTIPLIAIAPIANNWFGALNPFSKMFMAALLVFFPVAVNVTRGLVEVPPAAIELMRSYAASDTETLRKVRIPNMLPFLFTALKVGTTLAFIGAIIAEYFGGSGDVLGYVILNHMYQAAFDVSWAGILIGAAAAIVAYLVISAIERAAIPWYISLRSGEA